MIYRVNYSTFKELLSIGQETGSIKTTLKRIQNYKKDGENNQQQCAYFINKGANSRNENLTE